jgi:acetyl esterase/lipase
MERASHGPDRVGPVLVGREAELDELLGLLDAAPERGSVRLVRAGVDVTATRYAGIIHDFMMLNALAETNGARAATAQAAAFLHDALH